MVGDKMRNILLFRLLLLLIVGGAVRLEAQKIGSFSSPARSTDEYPLAFNEIMSSNATVTHDEDGDYEDWIELINHSGESVDLQGWGLSDNLSEPYKWVFPNVTMAPGTILLVWASGKNRIVPGSALHCNFSIKATGEDLLLTNPSGTLTDHLPPIVLSTDISAGRFPDGTGDWYFFQNPTPAAINTTQTFNQIVTPPLFSIPGGFLQSGTNLIISHPDPNAVIVYTLDGSEPDIDNLEGTTYRFKNSYPQNPGDPFGPFLYDEYSSHLYTGPIPIQDRSSEPDKLTHKSTTSDLEPTYFPNNPVHKSTVVRAKAYKPECIPSSTTTNSYFVFPQGRDEYQLPVVAMNLNEDLLFDYNKGLYVAGTVFDTWRQNNPSQPTGVYGNWSRDGDLWEYPANIEYFDTGEWTANLNQSLGFRMHGFVSLTAPRKSLSLYARDEYGESSLNWKFFSKLSDDSFKRLILRNAGNYEWRLTLFKDAAIQEICEGLHFDTQAYEPAILFINGEYWGIHNIREKYDKHYLARVYGADEDMVDIGELSNLPVEGDLSHYNALLNFIRTNSLANQANYDYVSTLMDIQNFTDYQISEIFARNNDWPKNNIKYWRAHKDAYEPQAPYGLDGRWRWLMYDVEQGFGSVGTYQDNSLTRATYYYWSNITPILTKLLANQAYKSYFINRFADLLNTYFQPARTTAIINQMKQKIQPEMAEHIGRWGRPTSVPSWDYYVNVMLSFVNNRPYYQRQHILGHFGLSGEAQITLDVSNQQQGFVRINTIEVAPTTPGISAAPYPWTGVYFQGVPIEVEAIPFPGYIFSHWEGDAVDTEPELSLTPSSGLYLKAVFEELPSEEREIIHYWHFDNLPDGPLISVQADYSVSDTGVISYPGTGTGYIDSRTHRAEDPVSNLNLLMGQQPDQGAVLRVRNPSNTRELLIQTPSTGFHSLTGAYAISRTSNGATEQEFYYSTNGGLNWIQIGSAYTIPELPTWELKTFDLSADPSVDNNSLLMFKILFTGLNNDLTAGNDRLDNLSLHGIPLPGLNMPPEVLSVPETCRGIEGGSQVSLDMSALFSDPEGDPVSFSASSSRPEFVQAQTLGNILVLSPLRRGDAQITLSANDGTNPDVTLSFRVLVYPQAYSFTGSDFSFNAWNPSTAELIYPEHMLFLQSDVNDPNLAYSLEYPYYIAHNDYHDDDAASIGLPYQLTGRTRLNGLGEDGIAFINTGRGRDLGGALLALNTVGVDELELSWLGGTLVQNSRIYAIRLQYRIGIEGDFSDLLIGGLPVEYVTATDGNSQIFSDLQLPVELLGQEYVQLLWKYYYVSGSSGARAQLRLDNISVSELGDQLTPVQNLAIEYLSDSDAIKLSWSYEIEATNFLIYGSEDPYFSPGPDSYLGSVDYPVLEYVDSDPQDRRFYVVIAQSLPRDIEPKGKRH